MSSEHDSFAVSPRSVFSQLTYVGIPASIASVAEPIQEAVDTMIAGTISVTAIAGLGLAASLILFIGKGFNFLYFGTVSRCASVWGRGDRQALNQYLWTATCIGLGLGLVLGIGVWLGAPWIIEMTGSIAGIQPPAREYLEVRAYSFPAIVLMYAGLGLFRGIGRNVAPLVMVFVTTLLNGLLSVVFVHVLDMGMSGLAWGTNIALYVLLLGYYAWAWYRIGVRIPPVGLRFMPLGDFVESFGFALPMIVRSLSLTGAISMLAVGASQISETAGAAHYVIIQVVTVASMIIEGQMVTIQSMVGVAMGEGRPMGEVRRLIRLCLIYALGAGVLASVAMALTKGLLIRLFTDDGAVIGLASVMVWIPIGMTVVHYVAYAYDSIEMGVENFRFTSLATFIAGVSGAGFALVGVRVWPSLVVVWIGFEIMMVLRSGLQGLHMHRWLKLAEQG